MALSEDFAIGELQAGDLLIASTLPALEARALLAHQIGVTRERLEKAPRDILILHPGPMNEGVEIAPHVAAGPRSLVTAQVAAGVPVRMAILALLTEAGSDA